MALWKTWKTWNRSMQQSMNQSISIFKVVKIATTTARSTIEG